jgi:hypothetical protein
LANQYQRSCRPINAEQDLARGDTLAIDRAAILTPMSALGRYLITRRDTDIASFKTPDLRNVLVTGPYFHDGSLATLWDVMDHYNKGDGVQDPFLDVDIHPLALQEKDIDDSAKTAQFLIRVAGGGQGLRSLRRRDILERFVRVTQGARLR